MDSILLEIYLELGKHITNQRPNSPSNRSHQTRKDLHSFILASKKVLSAF